MTPEGKDGLQWLNPLTLNHWNDMLPAVETCSIFHTSFWARVLQETHHYRPLCLVHISKEQIKTLIPLMEVHTWLTVRRGVSLPFSDYCDPIVQDGVPDSMLMSELIRMGTESNWRYLELRGELEPLSAEPPHTSCYGHVLDLKDFRTNGLGMLRSSTRRNIRKAARADLQVRVRNDLEALRDYYRLHCLTRQRHGVPPQSRNFFDCLWKHLLSNGRGVVILASHGGRNVAGAVILQWAERAYYKFGAMDMAFKDLRPFYRVMCESIRYHADRGYRSLCFGKTAPQNLGLLQFKRGWGTTEREIHYYRYDLKKGRLIAGAGMRSPLVGRLSTPLSRLPVPVLRLTGTLLYRHIG